MNQPGSNLREVDAVLGIASIAGASVASETHGDAAMATLLDRVYGFAEDAAHRGHGRIVKVMGDGVLFMFPVDRAGDAVNALEEFRVRASAAAREVDGRCRMQVKLTAGPVLAGEMGPPSDRRFDVYGRTLNALFKMKSDDFVVAPSLAALLKR